MLKHYQAHLFIQVFAPQDGKAYPHHHPKFKIDEKSMLVARSRGCSCVRLLKFKIKIAIST